MQPDPKPARRIVDDEAGADKVRAEGACRACGYRGSDLSRAHLVSKGQRGDDVDANIVPLCGDGTRGCHGALTDHTDRISAPSKFAGYPWRRVAYALRVRLRHDELDYVLRTKGGDWLNRVYPVAR